jgi:hypothetical protein
MAARVAWVFRDLHNLTTPEEYAWEVNPREFDIGYRKSVQYETTTAPDGRALIYEGQDEVKKINFSGTILVEDQYDAMIYWFSKRYQLQLEDDLGRLFSIYITSFQPKRERSSQYPWKHSYTCEALVLDWVS